MSNSFNIVKKVGVSLLTTMLCSAMGLAELPSGWLSTDIGNPALSGSTTYDSNSHLFVIHAAGQDIWERSDQFHFLYQPTIDNFSVETGNISGLLPYSGVHPWAKSGVMIRETLDPDSPYVFFCNTGNNGLRIQWRDTKGVLAKDFNWVYGLDLEGNQLFLKIERVGNIFCFLVSSNQGGFFDDRGVFLVASLEVAMTDFVYAGTAVTSHDANQLISVEIQDFRTDIAMLNTPATSTIFAVNSGSNSSSGEFQSDRSFIGNSYRYRISHVPDFNGSAPDRVYQRERFGRDFSYQINTGRGQYFVKLFLAEIFFDAPGKRIFDITVENGLVVDDLDLFAEAGKNNAFDIEVENVYVAGDGILDIDFSATVNNAKISGILINKAPYPINPGAGAPTPTYNDLLPKILFPLEGIEDLDGPERLFIKQAITFPDNYGVVGTLEIVGDAVIYTPDPLTPFLGPSIWSESFEVIVSDGLSDTSVFYYPYFE
ncbi:MAG: malectin domain-containing carbohydrate-binding protein [Verrucomicrobiota bacterium]